MAHVVGHSWDNLAHVQNVCGSGVKIAILSCQLAWSGAASMCSCRSSRVVVAAAVVTLVVAVVVVVLVVVVVVAKVVVVMVVVVVVVVVV